MSRTQVPVYCYLLEKKKKKLHCLSNEIEFKGLNTLLYGNEYENVALGRVTIMRDISAHASV